MNTKASSLGVVVARSRNVDITDIGSGDPLPGNDPGHPAAELSGHRISRRAAHVSTPPVQLIRFDHRLVEAALIDDYR